MSTKDGPSFDVRGKDIDTIFATNFTSDRCMTALVHAQQKFHPDFPGWALYRRVLIGDDLLDRTIEAFAIGMARGVARARKVNGRAVVPEGTRGPWIAQAARDAIDFALYGRFPCGVGIRASQFSMRAETFQRVRDATAAGIWQGIDAFASEARYQFTRAGRSN